MRGREGEGKRSVRRSKRLLGHTRFRRHVASDSPLPRDRAVRGTSDDGIVSVGSGVKSNSASSKISSVREIRACCVSGADRVRVLVLDLTRGGGSRERLRFPLLCGCSAESLSLFPSPSNVPRNILIDN